MDELDQKVYQNFAGRVVDKAATASVKENNNVPIYVSEYLLGSYCTSDSDDEIQAAVKKVNDVLSTNYVRNDEVELIKTRTGILLFD
jgi:ATP-dependent Lon protease